MQEFMDMKVKLPMIQDQVKTFLPLTNQLHEFEIARIFLSSEIQNAYETPPN